MMDVIDGSGGPPVFFQPSVLEPRAKDEHERKLEKFLQTIGRMTSGLSDRESIDALNLHISRGHYEEVQLGLLSMILTSAAQAPRSFQSLAMTNRDQWKCVRDCLFNLLSKWRRLTEQIQGQIVWFCGALLQLGPNPVIMDLVMLLFRNVAPGDLSPRNIWLADALLRVFIEHRPALDRQPFLVDCIVYCFLSIIVDHSNQAVSQQLRKAEIEFTVQLLRDKWDECCGIGRDLIRLLHGVARIPEFESIWYDLLHNPTNLSPTFQGLVSLLRRRTSRRFLLLRITPDLEQKFFFVTTKVRMSGPFMRHLDWLKRNMVAAQGPTLRCELIRYICGLIHPTMETINSDVIQRWYIIGWLLKCNPAAPPGDIALAKLALYFDWLGFDPATDNVMNIEPGVLLIFHSKPTQPGAPNMGSMLLDFLCRLPTSFHPPAAEDIRLGMLNAFKFLQEKRVVPLPNIGMLFDPRHLEQDVFFLCRQTFPELLPQQQAPQPIATQPGGIAPVQPGAGSLTGASGKFSDDEEISTELPAVAAASDALPYKPFTFVDENETLDDLENMMTRLGNDMAQSVRQVDLASENETKSQHVEEVLRKYQAALESDEAGGETVADMIGALPVCLLSALKQNFIKSPLPSLTATQEQFEESLSSAHFVIFHNILSSSLDEDDPARSSLISLVANMAARQGRVLAHFLYFLAVKQQEDKEGGKQEGALTKFQVQQLLRELIETNVMQQQQQQPRPSLEAYLMGCLEFCQLCDTQLFVFLLPFLYANFRQQFFDGSPNSSSNSEQTSATLTRLLRLTCQICDARQLSYLTAHILLRHVAFFTEANACSLLAATLQWETIEQVFVWQLFFAHAHISAVRLIPLVPKLKPEKHHEALVAVCNRFATLPPSTDVVSAVFSRSPSSNEFASPALLKSWSDANPNQLVDTLNQLLVAGQRALKSAGGKANQPRLVPVGGSAGLSRDQLLAHLDRFRLTAQDNKFLLYPPVQRLLSSIYQHVNEHLKNKYSDLFAMIDEKLVAERVDRDRDSSSPVNSAMSPVGGLPTPPASSPFQQQQQQHHHQQHHQQQSVVDSILGHHANNGNSNSTSNNNLSALSLLDKVASQLTPGAAGSPFDDGVPRLSSSGSNLALGSKLRRVQKRDPSSGGSGPPPPASSSASKVAKYSSSMMSD